MYHTGNHIYLMTIFDASSFKAIDDDTGSRGQVMV